MVWGLIASDARLKRFCLRRTETCSAFGVLRECAIQIYFYLLTYFAPTWFRRVSLPLLHKTTLTTPLVLVLVLACLVLVNITAVETPTPLAAGLHSSCRNGLG